MLLSWFSQDTMPRSTGTGPAPTSGRRKWILRGGPAGEVGNTITTDWSAVPSPSSFGHQHCLNVRPDGRLMLLDNSDGRGLVLSLDEAGGTATVDAAYPTHDGRCGPQGTRGARSPGTPVVGCAGDWVDEYDGTTGDQVWEAHVECAGGGGGYVPGAVRWYPIEDWSGPTPVGTLPIGVRPQPGPDPAQVRP